MSEAFIDGLDGDSASFVEGGIALILDQSPAASVTDSDSADFDGGNLTVAVIGGLPEDSLSIIANANILVAGNSVQYDADGGAGGAPVVIGTFSGGSGSTPLVVSFTSAGATPAAVEALIRQIAYQNTNTSDPAGADRTVRFTVNDGDGFTSANTDVTVHVTPVNDEPTLTAIAVNPTFTEGGTQVDLFDSVAVSTIEAGQRLTGMTWTVTNVASGANEFIIFNDFEIALTDGNSVVTDIDNMTIQVSLVGTTATLSFSEVSLSAGQLRNLINNNLFYKNTSRDPGTADRVITITELVDSGSNAGLDDGTAALAVTSTVHITTINDEPTLAATALDPTFTEGGAAADIFSGVTASTIEAGQTFTSMTLTVAGVVDGASEILSIDGSQVALTDGSSAVTAINGLTVTVTVAAGVATLTFSGATLDATELQALIDGLSYANTSQDPSAADRVVTITELGDSGANGGADDNTATLSIASTVHVTPVNDQPTLTAIAVNPTFTEGGTQVDLFDSVAVSTIEAGQRLTGMTWTVTNVASGANEFIIFNDFEIALTDGNSVVTDIDNMTIQVSLVGTTATLSFSEVSLSAGQLRNLINNDLFYKNTSRDPGTADRVITITELVDSGSNAGLDDGTAALAVTSTVHITTINDEPTLTATALDATFTEGGAAADIFGDVAASMIEAGQTFTSMTLTVAGVIDGASEILSIDGSQVALTDGSSAVTAINGLTVTVTVAAGVATLTFSGATLDATELQALIDGLSYANTSQDPSAADRVVTITELVDSGANGGADDNTATLSIASTVHVTPVNDQPTLTAIAVNPTFTEGGSAVDVFTTPAVALTVEAGQTFTSMTLTVTNVSAGASEILSLDGSSVALTNGNSVVTAGNGLTVNVSLTGTTASLTFNGATLDAAHLQSIIDGIAYSNTSEDPGAADRVVTITQLVDSGSNTAPDDGTAALGIASTVHMVPINDEPAGADNTITAFEDTARVLRVADFGFSDTDGNTLLAVKITTLPGVGSLANNGVDRHCRAD